MTLPFCQWASHTSAKAETSQLKWPKLTPAENVVLVYDPVIKEAGWENTFSGPLSIVIGACTLGSLIW